MKVGLPIAPLRPGIGEAFFAEREISGDRRREGDANVQTTHEKFKKAMQTAWEDSVLDREDLEDLEIPAILFADFGRREGKQG